MPPAARPTPRRFFAHDRASGRHSGHIVPSAEDFHDAAILFAETWAVEAGLAADPAGEVSVIVKDCETGDEQCFVVHLGDGEAEPC